MPGQEQPRALCAHAAEKSPANRITLSALAEVSRSVQRVICTMNRHGYSRRDVFAVGLALEEAIINAIKHGHRGQPYAVQVCFSVEADQVVASVTDQGHGFAPDAVPDPRSAENLERPSGRGLLLMRSLMTWVRFNSQGNSVTLCRRREAVAHAA